MIYEGFDVPTATLIVIEEPKRLASTQLHQLREGIGRESQKSTCLLLPGDGLSKMGQRRLALMQETQNGFGLAEKHLELRGGSQLIGTHRSWRRGFG